MTKTITLKAPKSKATITTNDEKSFIRFLKWLEEYHPTKNSDLSSYEIKSEKHLVACRLKAKKLNLNVT